MIHPNRCVQWCLVISERKGASCFDQDLYRFKISIFDCNVKCLRDRKIIIIIKKKGFREFVSSQCLDDR